MRSKTVFLTLGLFLVGWHGSANADGFAAVPGTGWTDIRELQSTCSIPGYFVNPSDCSRFYVCVDHSTPENKLLLRYDFDCPGGLAFDESTSNCNYPGPSGCVENGGGGSGGGGSGGGGWGWSKNPGIFQSTSTVNRFPAWGAAQTSIGGSTQTISRGPPVAIEGRTVFQVPTAQPAVPSNPRINLPQPQTTIVHIPATQWESQRIQPANPQVFQSVNLSEGSGGWSRTNIVSSGAVFQSARVAPTNPPTTVAWGGAQKIFPVNSGAVFQSARVTPTNAPTTVAWGGTREVLPVDSGAVFQSARVTPVPQAEWEVPQGFQVAPQRVTVVEQPSGGWGESFRVSSPSPAPSNPSGPGIIYSTVTRAPAINPTQATVTYQPARVFTQTSQAPGAVFQSSRGSPTPQPYSPTPQPYSPTPQPFSPTPQPFSPTPQPYSGGWQSVRVQQEQPANPSVSIIQSGAAVASNPTLQIPAPRGGWEGGTLTQLPSGYIWQSHPKTSTGPSPSNPQVSGPVTSTHQSYSHDQSVQSGNFGIIQQVINEEQAQSGEAGKSHIQLIYETKEKQASRSQSQSQNVNFSPQQQQQSFTVVPQNNEIQQQQLVSSQNQGNNAVYEIFASPESLPRGRVIVLYAPNNRGSKREAPLVEVELVDDDEDHDNDNSK